MPRTSRRLAASALALTLVIAACSSNGGQGAAASRSEGSDNMALYDNSVVHDISVTYDQAAYDEMVDIYVSSREKEWIEATVTIDGITLERVGLRLKGNSSLTGLARAGNAGRVPAGGAAGGPGGGVSRHEPESLPWLISLDRYIDGQSYQGHTEVVIRANNSETSLNEAVALELVGLAGEPTQKAFATRFQVNGGTKVLRLGIEHPNDEWDEATFDGEGILYKAESTGDYSYRGTDPKAYDEVFDQETDKDEENLAPLMGFLDFINNSTDEVFAAQLEEHLEVDAFARYLALQELLGNWDDIDGPGNNSYLRYDEETARFTVVTWDLNLAFGGGPGGNFGGRGTGNAPAGGGVAGAPTPPAAEPPAGSPGPPGGVFAGRTPPGDQGAAGVPAGQPPAGAAGGRAGGPGGRTNVLVQRFQANPTFASLYTQARSDLSTQLFATGTASEVLARWTGVLNEHASELVDAATVDDEATAISRAFAVQ